MMAAEHHRVAIVGAGFSGLGVAIHLEKRGTDYVVLERAKDVGGVWRDNTYPGCSCDIPSHVYSYSFELNPDWRRAYGGQEEILEYIRTTAGKHGVLRRVRLDHDVLEAAWDTAAGRWHVRTSHGELTADILVLAAGPLSDPVIPDIPGLDRFRGTAFHSARWNHDHDLTGERVGVIGTGASAIQLVPEIQPKVAALHVFQRSAPWVIPRLDREIRHAERAALRGVPGMPLLVRGLLYWINELRVVGFRRPKVMRVLDRVARWHLRRQVPDPELRRKLTPAYVMGCKRVLVSDNYYPSLTKPNVEVITDGIAEIRERSIVTRGDRAVEVDTIIFGTGFHVVDAPAAARVRGRDGRTLAEHWQGSMQAYKGSTVAGFPNMFFMIGPNTGLGHNSMIYMMESQIRYLLDALRLLEERRAGAFEVRRDAQERFDRWIQSMMRGTVWTGGRCQSWYLDAKGRNTTLWPTWSWRFRQMTRRFDAEAYALTGDGRTVADGSGEHGRAHDVRQEEPVQATRRGAARADLRPG